MRTKHKIMGMLSSLYVVSDPKIFTPLLKKIDQNRLLGTGGRGRFSKYKG